MLNMHDIVPSLRNKQVQAENILEEAGQILALDIDKASDKLHLAKEDFEKIGDKRPHVLRRITEISQAVLGSFFKKFVNEFRHKAMDCRICDLAAVCNQADFAFLISR